MSQLEHKGSIFVTRLKKLKKHLGITQAEMARVVHLTPQAMSNYFKGREPNYEVLVQICKTFDVSADYLLGLSDIPKAQTNEELEKENQYLRERLEEIQRIISETRGI